MRCPRLTSPQHLRVGLLITLCLVLAHPAGAIPYPQFFSSDAQHDTLLNDLFVRQARNGEGPTSLWQPGYPAAGYGTVHLWRDWEVDMLLWHDYSTVNYPLFDRPANFRGYTESIPIDRFGYVYSADDGPQAPIITSGQVFGFGWPFPSYPQSVGLSQGWEWNGTDGEGWTAVNATSLGATAGEWKVSSTLQDPQIVSPAFSANWFHAPFVNIELQYETLDDALTTTEKRFQFFWQTSEEPFFSEDKSVLSDSYPLVPLPEVAVIRTRRVWLPMYLHPKWRGKTITRVRFDPITSGDAHAVTFRISALRLDYDTRHPNNNGQFVRAAGRKFLWDRDSTFLKQQLPRMRKAMQCLLVNFDASSTLGVDHTWLIGHTGRGWYPGNPPTQRVGEGIGNNYFDILPMGPSDILSDVQYYRALETMATIEAHVAANPTLDSARPSIFGPDGVATTTYAETAASLRARIEPTRQAIHARYWNPATQRYGGWRDADGVLHDYGYPHFNLEAMEAGIPDATSAQAIIDWLDGRRIVAGDTSTGADIYRYGFAARVSTRRNTLDYVWAWGGYSVPFGDQVQDGGATMFTTFYDIRGRLRYGDVAGAWAVWQRMIAHHKRVLDWGGTGTDFYRKFYRDNPSEGKLQGGGPPGGLGLDVEFVESMMTPAAWVLGWLGVEVAQPNVLTIKPTLPPGVPMIGTRHVVYNNNDYTIRAEANVIDLAGSVITIGFGTRLELVFGGNYSAQTEVLRNGVPYTGAITRSAAGLSIEVAPTADRFAVHDPNAARFWSAAE